MENDRFLLAMLARIQLIEATYHICLAYVFGQIFRESPHNLYVDQNMVLTCQPICWILKFPWISWEKKNREPNSDSSDQETLLEELVPLLFIQLSPNEDLSEASVKQGRRHWIALKNSGFIGIYT